MTPQESEHILNECHAFAKYDSQQAFANVKDKIHRRKSSRLRHWWVSASAVAAILLITLMLWQPTEHISNDGNMPLLVELPDHSKVTLNKGASIVYAKDMTKRRTLQLKGEGFFDITPDPQRPFVIKAGKHQVRVLGTSFNVKCNSACEKLEVLVKSGKVEVSNSLNSHIILTKDEFVRGANDKLIISSIDKLDQNYLSWYQKKLVFNASPLSYVLEIVEKTYHNSVKVDIERIKDLKISTTFDGLKLEEVLTSICLTLDLDMRKEGATYVLYQE